LKHKSLGKWLQPGGHVDLTDNSILDACFREIQEETGIKKINLEYIKHKLSIPFDIDSHKIPANPKKKEEAHIHHDIRYCFRYRTDENIIIDKLESDGFKWISIKDLENDPIFDRVVAKLIV
jgi:8-oxo-dGTP pyrophosphatase MutT (NUDIX family)